MMNAKGKEPKNKEKKTKGDLKQSQYPRPIQMKVVRVSNCIKITGKEPVVFMLQEDYKSA